MEGYICLFNRQRHFGYIARKLEGGWLEKYFFLEVTIIRKEVEPDVYVPVIFDLDTDPHHQRQREYFDENFVNPCVTDRLGRYADLEVIQQEFDVDVKAILQDVGK